MADFVHLNGPRVPPPPPAAPGQAPGQGGFANLNRGGPAPQVHQPMAQGPQFAFPGQQGQHPGFQQAPFRDTPSAPPEFGQRQRNGPPSPGGFRMARGFSAQDYRPFRVPFREPLVHNTFHDRRQQRRQPRDEIHDTRLEVNTEEDARELLAKWVVCHVEKTNHGLQMDEDGFPVLPTWHLAAHRRDDGVSQKEAARMVRELTWSTPSVSDKKANLNPEIRKQLVFSQRKLEEEESDLRFRYELVQFNQIIRKVDVSPSYGYQDYPDERSRSKHRSHSRSSRSKHKKGKRYKKGKIIVEAHKSKRTKRVKQTEALVVYYKRVPKDDVDCLQMWEDREDGVESLNDWESSPRSTTGQPYSPRGRYARRYYETGERNRPYHDGLHGFPPPLQRNYATHDQAMPPMQPNFPQNPQGQPGFAAPHLQGQYPQTNFAQQQQGPQGPQRHQAFGQDGARPPMQPNFPPQPQYLPNGAQGGPAGPAFQRPPMGQGAAQGNRQQPFVQQPRPNGQNQGARTDNTENATARGFTQRPNSRNSNVRHTGGSDSGSSSEDSDGSSGSGSTSDSESDSDTAASSVSSASRGRSRRKESGGRKHSRASSKMHGASSREPSRVHLHSAVPRPASPPFRPRGCAKPVPRNQTPFRGETNRSRSRPNFHRAGDFAPKPGFNGPSLRGSFRRFPARNMNRDRCTTSVDEVADMIDEMRMRDRDFAEFGRRRYPRDDPLGRFGSRGRRDDLDDYDYDDYDEDDWQRRAHFADDIGLDSDRPRRRPFMGRASGSYGFGRG